MVFEEISLQIVVLVHFSQLFNVFIHHRPITLITQNLSRQRHKKWQMLVIQIHNFYCCAHLDQTSPPNYSRNPSQTCSTIVKLVRRHVRSLSSISPQSVPQRHPFQPLNRFSFISGWTRHGVARKTRESIHSLQATLNWFSLSNHTGFNELLLEIIFNSFSLFHYIPDRIPEKLSMTRRKKESESIESSSTPKNCRRLCQVNWALQTLYRWIFYFDAVRSPSRFANRLRAEVNVDFQARSWVWLVSSAQAQA